MSQGIIKQEQNKTEVTNITNRRSMVQKSLPVIYKLGTLRVLQHIPSDLKDKILQPIKNPRGYPPTSFHALDGGVRPTVRFDINASCYLEICREVEQKIADAKDAINVLKFSLITFFFSQTFLYLTFGSTQLTLPFKIRVKHRNSKRKPTPPRKEVSAALDSTFFLTSLCLFPFISIFSLLYKTEPLLRASSLRDYIMAFFTVILTAHTQTLHTSSTGGRYELLPLVTPN